MEETNQGGNKKVYIAIIVLLLLINGVALYLLWNENKAKNELTDTKAKLEIDIKGLTDTLDAKSAELEQFRGKNAEMDSIITVRQAEIETQKRQLKAAYASNTLSKNDVKKANEKIVQYESSIADLQKKVDELTQKNQALTTQNQQLNTDLTTEKQTTTQLSEQNKGLSKKVELGSLLHLQNMTVEGIKKKGNGKEVTVTKGKTVESLKISFETGDNKVLEAGNLSLYLRVLNPKGETISVADQGSGSLKLAGTEQDLQYTKKADVDWNQSNKKVVVYWSQNVKEAGTYKVEVYQSGYVIGNGAVTFK